MQARLVGAHSEDETPWLQTTQEGLHVVAQCQTPIRSRGNKCNFPRLLFNKRVASVSLGVPNALPHHRFRCHVGLLPKMWLPLHEAKPVWYSAASCKVH